jgi:23S rRNA pseudouridine2605 synthase
LAERFVYVILHKPRGVVSTLSDPEGRETVQDLLRGVGVRVVPVGRLDFHTSGALLCTNDGDFASKLLHPRGGVPKEYIAKVRGVLKESDLAKFRESIVIEGRATQPAQVRLDRVEGDKTWIQLVLREGRNRQVRRLGEAAGFPVLRLARTAHAGITTHDLRPGQWRHLSQDELADLKRVYGVPKVIHAPFEAPQNSRQPATSRPRRPTRSKSRGAAVHEPSRFGEAPGRSSSGGREGSSRSSGAATKRLAPRSKRASASTRSGERVTATERASDSGRFGAPRSKARSSAPARLDQRAGAAPRERSAGARSRRRPRG